MGNRILIVFFFVSLNVLLGYLFQRAIDYTCFMELMIIAGTSFTFWVYAARFIQQTAPAVDSFQRFKPFCIQAGIGLSAGLLNILTSTGIMFLSVLLFTECTSRGFDLLNGTLTNNLALNLLCYFSLAFVYSKREPVEFSVPEKTVETEADFLLLSSGNTTHKCSWTDILYVEASNNCIVIHTVTGTFVRYQSLRSFVEQSPIAGIQRVHRSYAVNMDQVRSYDRNKNGDGFLYLQNGRQVKFSRNFFSGW